MGNKTVSFQLQRIRQTLTSLEGGGGRGGDSSPPWVSNGKLIHTQERKKIVTGLKYCKGCVPGLEAAQHANNLILSRDQRIPY